MRKNLILIVVALVAVIAFMLGRYSVKVSLKKSRSVATSPQKVAPKKPDAQKAASSAPTAAGLAFVGQKGAKEPTVVIVESSDFQ